MTRPTARSLDGLMRRRQRAALECRSNTDLVDAIRHVLGFGGLDRDSQEASLERRRTLSDSNPVPSAKARKAASG